MIEGQFQKTNIGLERLFNRIEWREGKPFYGGRRVIGRDAPIINGVYLGAGEREAIVVHDSPALIKLFNAAKELARIEKLKPNEKEDRILGAVYDTITKKVKKAEPGQVEAKMRELNVGSNRKVSLDVFLKHGGNCRHLNLAIAAVLEKFKAEGHLPGHISVDRNYIPNLGGHAWARYEHSDREVRIADAMQGFLGKMKHAKNWAYSRPNE